MKFQINGEYITEQARSMYFDDKCQYKEVQEFLSNYLYNDEISKEEINSIIHEIIEGRKKLVGINEFDIVDDNENIREITEEDIVTREDESYQAVVEHMAWNISNYIDPFAFNKSWNFFIGSTPTDAYEYAYTSAEDIARIMRNVEVRSLEYSIKPVEKLNLKLYADFSEKEELLHHGAYLAINPLFVYKLMGKPVYLGNISELYEKLYKYWNNSPYKDEPVIQRRQKEYLKYKKAKEEKRISIHKKIQVTENDIHQKATPDREFISEYGIIDPDGRWYNVEWGKHALRAVSIIKSRHKDIKEINPDQALDMIIEKGYILIRNVSKGEPRIYISPKIFANSYQQKCIEDYKEYFNIEKLEEDTIYMF